MNEKRLRIVFIVFSLIFPVWIIILRILPFTDLPFRLMASTILRYYNSPEYLFSEFYTIPTLLKSNVFHLIFCSLSVFPDVEIANKIYYIIYFISFPVLMYFLIKKIKGNKWFALLSFFILFNSDVHWGFADYSMSLSVLILFLMLLIEVLENKSLINSLKCPLLILITFFIHFQIAIFESALLVICVLIYFKKDVKNILLYFIWLLPVAMLMAYVYLIDANRGYEDMLNYLYNYYTINYIPSFFSRIRNLFFINNLHLSSKPTGVIIGLVVSAIILLPLIIALIKKSFKINLKSVPVIFTISTLFFYLTLPRNIPGQDYVYIRFAEIFFIGIILISSQLKLPQKVSSIYINFAIGSLVIFFLIVSEYFYSFNNTVSGFRPALFEKINSKSVLTAIIDNQNFRERPIFIHFQNYYTVWNKGISTGLVDYRYGVIRRKANEKILPGFDAWNRLDNNYSIDQYIGAEFLLLKSKGYFTDINFNLIDSSGEWKIYKRNF